MCSHVKIIVNLHATESRWPNRLPHAPALLAELKLQASKDDEAAAKWLELVSSCGFLFPPNKASIFSLRAPSAPHLHYRGRREGEMGVHKMNLRIFGILFYSCCGRGGKRGQGSGQLGLRLVGGCNAAKGQALDKLLRF